MVIIAIANAWSATIPIFGAGIGLSGPILWRFSSVLSVVTALLFVWPIGWAGISLARERGKFNLRYSLAILPLAVAATVVHALNAAGFPYGPSYAGFVAGIWLGFSVAVLMFVMLIGRLLR